MGPPLYSKNHQIPHPHIQQRPQHVWRFLWEWCIICSRFFARAFLSFAVSSDVEADEQYQG